MKASLIHHLIDKRSFSFLIIPTLVAFFTVLRDWPLLMKIIMLVFVTLLAWLSHWQQKRAENRPSRRI